jgi:hypothetical protein
MRWAGAILFHLVAGAAALLFLATVLVGVRSFFVKDVLRWDKGETSHGVSISTGRVAVMTVTTPDYAPLPPAPPSVLPMLTTSVPTTNPATVPYEDLIPSSLRWPDIEALRAAAEERPYFRHLKGKPGTYYPDALFDKARRFAGFSLERGKNPGGTGWAVVLPLWVPAVVLGWISVVMTRGSLRRWRGRRRRRENRCPGCGYDLRATPTACPECGEHKSDNCRAIKMGPGPFFAQAAGNRSNSIASLYPLPVGWHRVTRPYAENVGSPSRGGRWTARCSPLITG